MDGEDDNEDFEMDISDHYISFVCTMLLDRQSNIKSTSVMIGFISKNEEEIREKLKAVVTRDSTQSNILFPIIYKIGDRKMDDLYLMSLQYFENLTKVAA